MNEQAYRDAENRLWEHAGVERIESIVTLPRIGARVRVQETGEGEPVLFIHGGPNSGSTWVALLEHLDGFHGIVVDRPGTGLSAPHHVDRHNLVEFGERFVGDVLDGLGIDTAHVIASSFGGQIAIRSASVEGHRIRRMVQLGCPAFAPGMQTPLFMRALTIRPLRRLINALPPNEQAGDRVLRQIGHGASLDAGRIPQSFKDWYLALQRYTDTNRNETEMIGSLGSLSGFHPSLALTPEILASVETPTVFLWGEDDGFGGVESAEATIDPMPNAQAVMLKGSGHLPWLDDARLIARLSGRFLRGEAISETSLQVGHA